MPMRTRPCRHGLRVAELEDAQSDLDRPQQMHFHLEFRPAVLRVIVASVFSGVGCQSFLLVPFLQQMVRVRWNIGAGGHKAARPCAV